MKTGAADTTEIPLGESIPVACTQHNDCIRMKTDEMIFTATVLAPTLILQLPMEYIDGRPVPTVIFDGQQSTFQAFLLCIVGACYGSVYSMLLRETKPKIPRYCNGFALLCVAAGLAIFFWAATSSGLRTLLPLLVNCHN